MTLLVLILVAYAVGSLPFGLWLVRAQGIDLRTIGSGNIGATNVWRATGRTIALLVLVLDAGKGALAVLLARVVIDEPYALAACAVAVVAGHVWPVWAGFRGGKGVATVAGAFALIEPTAVVWCVMAFGCFVAMTRWKCNCTSRSTTRRTPSTRQRGSLSCCPRRMMSSSLVPGAMVNVDC